MTFTPKVWQNSPSTATPTDAAAFVDLETRLAAYTDLNTSRVNVKDYGAVGDGVTNDDTAIGNAITAAAASASKVLFFPTGTYLKTSITNLADSVIVVGVGRGSSIQGPGFQLANKNLVTNMRFVATTPGVGTAIATISTTAQTNSTVQGCWFEQYQIGVSIAGTSNSSSTSGMKIIDNYFDTCGYGIFQIYGSHNLFSRNTIVSSTSSAITFYGGSYNAVMNNRISGGVTGIVFLYTRSTSGSKALVHNTIQGNLVTGVTQESISLDCHGNTAADVSVFDWDTVSAKAINGSNVNITLTHANFASSGTAFGTYYIEFRTGKLAGQVFKILTHSNSLFTVEMDTTNVYPLVTVGDEFVIGAPFFGNSIIGNIVDASGGTASILLYGNCHGNTVMGNTVYGKDILLTTLSSLVRSSINVTTRFGRAFCEGNVVIGNTTRTAGIKKVFTDFGADPFPEVCGNNITGNFVTNGVTVTSLPAAISPTGSPFSYQNYDAYNEIITIQGGTVSLVEISADGTTHYNCGTTAGSFFLSRGSIIRITYSVIPTAVTKHPVR
jgi:hypothetical protein